MNNFTPDFLKPFDQVFQPDLRNIYIYSEATIGFQEHYKMIADITLNETVHDDVKVQFETAKNVLLYSFFAYRLGMVGLKQAFAALELGLRRYVGESADPASKKKLRNGLTALLERAHTQGMFTAGLIKPGLAFEDFLKIMKDFRNRLAHGTHILMPPHVIMPIVQDCAAVLNQVYDHVKANNLCHSIDGWE
jgi:hypothetical protein